MNLPMSHKPLTIDQLRELIATGEASDPIVFLESVMNGQDPRRINKLFELVNELHAFSGGEPTPADWLELVDFVNTHLKYSTVSITESIGAAKTLSEYLHPKRKQIDIGGEGGAKGGAAVDLTPEEIELFKEKFNDEF